MNNQIINQMELPLAAANTDVAHRTPLNRARQLRATWWFAQMRAAVDRPIATTAPQTAPAAPKNVIALSRQPLDQLAA